MYLHGLCNSSDNAELFSDAKLVEFNTKALVDPLVALVVDAKVDNVQLDVDVVVVTETVLGV